MTSRIYGISHEFDADGIKQQTVQNDFVGFIEEFELSGSSYDLGGYFYIEKPDGTKVYPFESNILRGSVKLNNLSMPLDIGDKIVFSLQSYDAANGAIGNINVVVNTDYNIYRQ